jgi:phage baseplate assembly protein W
MPSGCTLFPFEKDLRTSSLKRTENINDTIKSAIKVFLLTRPGQRRGNPIGSFIGDLKHQILPPSALKEVSTQLRQELTEHFPGILFVNIDVKQIIENNIPTLNISITFQTALSQVEELKMLI